MWLTVARSNTCSPGPARLAPGVRAAGACVDISRSSCFSAVFLRLSKDCPPAEGNAAKTAKNRNHHRFQSRHCNAAGAEPALVRKEAELATNARSGSLRPRRADGARGGEQRKRY